MPMNGLNGMPQKRQINFMFPCPKGHGPTFNYDADALRQELDHGTLKLFCGMCGESYTPSEQMKNNLRKRLAEAEAEA